MSAKGAEPRNGPLVRSSAACLFLIALTTAAVAQRRPSTPVQPPEVIRTPYAVRGALGIGKVTLAAASIPRYGRLEATVDLSATYDDPFDPRDFALEGRVTTPSGRRDRIFGFLYRSFNRELKQGREVLTPAGPPIWRLRYCPSEAGPHTLAVTARDRTGSAGIAPVRFTVTKSADPGFVRVSAADRRFFQFEMGRSYYPVGADVCWGGNAGTFDYDAWFPAYARAGCNYARLWLSPHWTTFALERTGTAEQGLGLGQLDLANAWRLDYVLSLAERQGLYLMLCIDSYNVLRARNGFPEWEKSPQNAANGGPLRRPEEFWTDPAMDYRYQDKLRYLVARYGASTHVLSWEFWNEVDGVTGYSAAPVRDWHERMGRILHGLDPYSHLVTTSFSRSEGEPSIDRLPELDYVQTHHYGSPDLVRSLVEAQQRKAAYGKPHYVGEVGADSNGPRAAEDPEGLQIHDPLWVTIATGGSGAAQPWWWDSYIHPRRLYPVFTHAARFVTGIDWPGEGFKPVSPRVEWRVLPKPLPRADILLENGPATWAPSAFNRPRTVQITRTGARGDLPLAGIQHGLQNHPDLHDPVAFQTDLPWPTRFEVEVGDVSGYGGAALRIQLDGKPVLEKEFPDTDGGTKTLTQYRGSYGIDLAAGRHTLRVEDTGKDWFMAAYRFRSARERSGPPLEAWAIRGRSTALAWARVEGRTWQRVCALKETVPPAPASVLVLSGLVPGEWRGEVWNTWTGAVIGRQQIRVDKSGESRIFLPVVEKDVAAKLRRIGAAPAPRTAPLPRAHPAGERERERDRERD